MRVFSSVMRRRLQILLARLQSRLNPPPDQTSLIHSLEARLEEALADRHSPRARYLERVAELAEARAMAGSGPWSAGPATLKRSDMLLSEAMREFNIRESADVGAFRDIELTLQVTGWRREIDLASMEFSRWGISQIILIARLHYVKNPIIRRLVDVVAGYVFARGVSVTSSDDDANQVIQDFLEFNREVLGQNALCDLERRKDYDGNIFFVLFTDTQSKGRVKVRTIDATEISEIHPEPEDADTPRYYKREWSQQVLDETTGEVRTEGRKAWYPAITYKPDPRPAMIGGDPVMWDQPILHRKCGGIAKWRFGCPRIYPAIDWAKESRKYLESCASVAQALAEIALVFTSKGGQAALAGVKDQFGTSVTGAGGAGLWDTNPPPTAGIFASGPGTKLEAFKTSGAGLDPEKVRQYKLMCCMVVGVPETFLGDVQTGNLATAQSLDRPTETAMLERQESWREDLVTLASYAVKASMLAPGGRLREAKRESVPIREAARVTLANGRKVYAKEARKPADGAIEIRAEFPAIREGDISTLIAATVDAMTLGAPSGGVTGIDEKEGVRQLYDLLGIENGDELVEAQYPSETYDPERAVEEPAVEPPQPGVPGARPAMAVAKARAAEADRIEAAMRKLGKAVRVYEASRAATMH